MNEFSPCVLPRRRFVLWFLGGCVLWVVACCVYLGTLSREWIAALEFETLFLLECAMLAIPSRSAHGTLMQLVGLAMPLSAAVILILCGIESYTGVYIAHSVFWPFAIIFWCGSVLYPLVYSSV